MNADVKKEIKEEILEDEDIHLETNIKDEIVENETETKGSMEYLFQCEICPEEFKMIELYDLHKFVHDPQMTCPPCNRSFLRTSCFVEHIADHLKNYFKCEYCPKILFRKGMYMSHRATHKKNICNYCSKSFSTKKQRVVHERVHTNERPYKCEQCDKSFKQTSTLGTHLLTHQDKKLYNCESCNGTFATSSSLRRHFTNIHATGRSMKCKRCDQDFYNQESLYKHRMEQHPYLMQYYRVCPICSQEFLTKAKFMSHKKMHLEKGEIELTKTGSVKLEGKPTVDEIKCVVCGMNISNSHYRNHQNEHLKMTKEEVRQCELAMSFPCKECDNVSVSKRGAIHHLDKHLQQTMFCRYSNCDYKSAMTYMKYREHEKVHHREFTCGSCLGKFLGALQLRKHKTSCLNEISKTEMELHSCEVCKTTFTDIWELSVHTCSGPDNKFKCNHCSKKYIEFRNIKAHLLVKHKNQTSQHIKLNMQCGCTYCHCIFGSLWQLQEHLNQEHPDEDKYVCKLCSKTFKCSKTFIRHKTDHWKAKEISTMIYKVTVDEVVCQRSVREEPDDDFVDLPENVIVEKQGEDTWIVK